MQMRHAQDIPEFDLETFNLLTHETQLDENILRPRFPPLPISSDDGKPLVK